MGNFLIGRGAKVDLKSLRAAFDKHSDEVARNLADVKARIASLQQVQERAITVADNWTRTVRQHERNMAPFGALPGRSVWSVNQSESGPRWRQPDCPGVRGFLDAFALNDDPDLPAFDDEDYTGANIIVLIILG